VFEQVEHDGVCVPWRGEGFPGERGRSFASPIKMNERPVIGTAKMSTNGTSRTYPPGA